MPNYDQEDIKSVEDAVRKAREISSSWRSHKSLFIEKMAGEHRTTQQYFTGLCLQWLAHLAQLKDHQFDLRNEASVMAARKCMAALDNNPHLPLI